MTTHSLTPYYILFCILGVIGFCLPAILFVYRPYFSNLWELYLGNFILMAVIWVSVVVYHSRYAGLTIASMMSTSLKLSFLVILVSLVLMVAVILIHRQNQLYQAPANLISSKTSNNLIPVLLLDTSIVNVFACSFAALLASLTSFRSQR